MKQIRLIFLLIILSLNSSLADDTIEFEKWKRQKKVFQLFSKILTTFFVFFCFKLFFKEKTQLLKIIGHHWRSFLQSFLCYMYVLHL